MTSPAALPPVAEPRTHGVHLYSQDDDALVQSLARYVSHGLARGDAILVISTTPHWGALLGQLRREDVDLAGPVREGTLIFLPAEDVLPRLISEGRPSRESFESIVGAQVRGLRARPDLAQVRVFGELVGVLWQQGRCTAALELEELWNRLLEAESFRLYCAYPIDVAGEQPETATIEAVLQAHTHLLPSGEDVRHENPALVDATVDGIADGRAPGGTWSEVGRWTVDSAGSLAEIRRRIVAAARTHDVGAAGHGDGAVAPLVDAPARLSMVCGELAANGLRYGRPPITVALARGERSWLVVVSDQATANRPVLGAPDLNRGGKIGLHLVTAVSDRVGWHVSGASKHVWAEVGDRAPAGVLF